MYVYRTIIYTWNADHFILGLGSVLDYSLTKISRLFKQKTYVTSEM